LPGQHAARPAAVELVQAIGDARAARPVLHRAHHLADGEVGVPALQESRGAREPGAEDEALHRRFGVCERVREVQQHARILAHRAGNVGQQHQRRRARAAGAPAKVPELAAVARHRAQGAAPVHAARPAGGAGAAREQRLEDQLHLRQQALGLAPFIRGHGLEVGLLQPLALIPAQRGLEFHLLGRGRLGRRPRRVREQSRRQAPVLGRGRGAVLGLHLGQQQRAHATGQVGVAPEEFERLVEERAVLGAVEQAGREHGVEIGA
jgi:hypothetical protein